MIGDVASGGPPAATVHAASRQERLSRLADDHGIVAGIALDHRDSLRAVLEQRGLGDLSDDEVRELKVRLAAALATAATAIMLDEELGGLALDQHVVPHGVGLIMPLEAQGGGSREDPMTRLMTDFTAADAAQRGAVACKVLLPYRPDRPGPARHQDAVVRAAAQDCQAAGLSLVIEPLVYRLVSESPDAYASTYPALVADAVSRIREGGVDLLKLPFPVLHPTTADEDEALEACRRLDAACAGIPWVLLGAGADADVFETQIRIAGTAGASGFLVGRGIWGAALHRDPDAAGRAAAGRSRDDLLRCRDVARRYARPLPRAS